jgi:hypothetical protein
LIQCEYRFENFDARGDEEYLDRIARQLDELFRAGWTAPEVNRDSTFSGWWKICLYKENRVESEGAPLRPRSGS